MMRLLDPVTEFNTLRREIDRVFEGFRNGPASAVRGGRFPAVNIVEDAETIEAEVRVPGLDPQSLNVSVLRDQLTISGEKPGLPEGVKGEAIHRNERVSGRFIRTIALPAEVDPEKVTAEYRNGIVSITLPKSETARPRQIEVAVG